MPRATCDVECNGSAPTRAREFARDTLRVWQLDDLCVEAEMVTTELVTNAVLHGEPPISLALEYDEDLLRISVGDHSVAPPVPGRLQSDAMTGRGLALVAAVSARWGVVAAGGGKQVWAELATAVAEEAAPPASSGVDLEAILQAWAEPEADEETYEIVLGDVPTDLLVAAKAHVDNIVRELTLASYEPTPAGVAPRGQLRADLAELLRDVVIGFAQARQSIKLQALAAAARGDERTSLSLTVGAEMAEAGERYLAGLDAVDEYARAERLLTVETPPEHKVFRRWYVQSLVDQLRAKAHGLPAPSPVTFERYLLGEVHTISAAQRMSSRAARLQRVTVALAGAHTPDDVARVTVAECVAATGALDGVLVLRGEQGGLTPTGGAGSVWPVMDSDAVERALEDGRPVWVRNVGSAALCAVPLCVAGDVVGALALSFANPQAFDADDRAFLDAVAGEAAQTLTRTRLHEEQALLARRLARLQSVAGELARRSDIAGVCEAAVRHGAGAIGATIAAVCLPTPDSVRLRIVDTLGGNPGQQKDFREFAIDGAFPASVAFRGGDVIVIDEQNRNSADFADFPTLDHPLVCLPLHAESAVCGVLTLSFRKGQRLGAAEIEFLMALADVCAQAITRAQALEAANRVSDRFAFLAEASRRLASSLDYENTLQSVAELAVPRLADWCGIDIVEAGRIVSAAVAHSDPAKVAFAKRFQRLYPPDPYSHRGVAGVIESGMSRLVTNITDEMLVERAGDERHLEMIRALGMRSALIVPLRAGGRVMGALSLIRTDDVRAFTDDDVKLAEDLAGRAGAAVENARLFREVQAARQTDSGMSHAWLDLALAAASIGSFEYDLSAGSVTMDSRMLQIFGIADSDFDGQSATIRQRVVEADQATVATALSNAISRIGDLAVEYRIQRPDGVVRWVDCRGRVLAGPDGVATRIIGIAFDSTDAREARDRVARTLEHMGDAFFSVDGRWRFTYVNAAAERLLGRDRSSLLGAVIWDESLELIAKADEQNYRKARETQQPVVFQRYVASTGRHFEVRIAPVPNGFGVYYKDVSESRQLERESAQLREASRHARSEADVARSRLAFLAEVSADITTTLDVTEVCQRLADHAVDRIADWVSVYVVEGRECHRVAAAHRDPRWAASASSLVDAFPIDIGSSAMVARAARTGVPVLEQHMTEQLIAETYPDAEGRALVDEMGVASAFVAPMIAFGEVAGVIAMIRSSPGNEFDSDELRLAVTLASRAGLAVQNARMYARQTTVAQALQQAVLPEALPRIDGVELSARYEPALGGAGVGGDFYDVFRLPSGRVALAVGDAAGHGLQSGALMGQLRNALRAYAVLEHGPSATLRSLSELLAALEPDAFATAFYAELEPSTGEVVWANAGHPPPLFIPHGGDPQYLRVAGSPPLGILGGLFDVAGGGGALVLGPGDGIFMYTDGLVERRQSDITDGLDRLRRLADAPGSVSTDAIVLGMREETGFADDVCALLAVRPL